MTSLLRAVLSVAVAAMAMVPAGASADDATPKFDALVAQYRDLVLARVTVSYTKQSQPCQSAGCYLVEWAIKGVEKSYAVPVDKPDDKAASSAEARSWVETAVKEVGVPSLLAATALANTPKWSAAEFDVVATKDCVKAEPEKCWRKLVFLKPLKTSLPSGKTEADFRNDVKVANEEDQKNRAERQWRNEQTALNDRLRSWKDAILATALVEYTNEGTPCASAGCYQVTWAKGPDEEGIGHYLTPINKNDTPDLARDLLGGDKVPTATALATEFDPSQENSLTVATKVCTAGKQCRRKIVFLEREAVLFAAEKARKEIAPLKQALEDARADTDREKNRATLAEKALSAAKDRIRELEAMLETFPTLWGVGSILVAALSIILAGMAFLLRKPASDGLTEAQRDDLAKHIAGSVAATIREVVASATRDIADGKGAEAYRQVETRIKTFENTIGTELRTVQAALSTGATAQSQLAGELATFGTSLGTTRQALATQATAFDTLRGSVASLASLPDTLRSATVAAIDDAVDKAVASRDFQVAVQDTALHAAAQLTARPMAEVEPSPATALLAIAGRWGSSTARVCAQLRAATDPVSRLGVVVLDRCDMQAMIEHLDPKILNDLAQPLLQLDQGGFLRAWTATSPGSPISWLRMRFFLENMLVPMVAADQWHPVVELKDHLCRLTDLLRSGARECGIALHEVSVHSDRLVWGDEMVNTRLRGKITEVLLAADRDLAALYQGWLDSLPPDPDNARDLVIEPVDIGYSLKGGGGRPTQVTTIHDV